jgi:hypothetical protein
MIVARVAPPVRPISARIFAPLLPARGAVALAGLAAFIGLAAFLGLGAAFFWVTPFFEEAFFDRTVRGGGATVAGCLVGSKFFMVVLFCTDCAGRFMPRIWRKCKRMANAPPERAALRCPSEGNGDSI